MRGGRNHQAEVGRLVAFAFDADKEHCPTLPIVVNATSGGFDPDALAEHVGDSGAADRGERSGRHREGHQEPVIGVYQPELYQQELRQIGRVRLHVAKVRAAVLKRPPARIRHACGTPVPGRPERSLAVGSCAWS